MYCIKCGKSIPDGERKCLSCDNEIEIQSESDSTQSENEKTTPENVQVGKTPIEETIIKSYPMTSNLTDSWLSVWRLLSIVSFICALISFFKGINKMVSYETGDYYPYESVNAYVGGDAYNYIINGNYATAFFVLTTMFVLAAIGLIIIDYISKEKNV